MPRRCGLPAPGGEARGRAPGRLLRGGRGVLQPPADLAADPPGGALAGRGPHAPAARLAPGPGPLGGAPPRGGPPGAGPPAPAATGALWPGSPGPLRPPEPPAFTGPNGPPAALIPPTISH